MKTTWQMDRCRDCAYLVEGKDGEWICDDWGKDIHNVPDDDCELMIENDEEEW